MATNFCTTRKAAGMLGVSVRTAQLWLEKGYLEGWKTAGGHRRITLRSVQRALRERISSRGTSQPAPVYSLPVLIVEDDPALLKLYREYLARWPFAVDVFTASNGYEALLLIGESPPRLLICDLRLPGISGFQLARVIRAMERYKDLVIVIVSGLITEEIEAHGGVPEGIEVMGKPIDFAQLQSIARGIWERVPAVSGA